MRYVDHDPAAARAAAQHCREAASTYDRTSWLLDSDPGRVRWWGCERDDVVHLAGGLADDLRREAAALRATADLLEAAARAAERREAELAAEARAATAAAAAAACPVAPAGPSVGPSQPQRQRARSSTSTGTAAAPVGAQ